MKIGVLHGRESSFPGALVAKINDLAIDGITAEAVSVGAIAMDKPWDYRVIIDRISQDVPFYRAMLKNAALTGTTIINNPFWWSADDKFFNYALAHKLGVAIPKTILLPHKQHPPDITDQSLRNLEYPLDWDGIFAYIGFPAFLKPHSGGGWKHVTHCHSPQDVFDAYDDSGDLCMTLQSAVDFTEYYRCYVIGQKNIRIMAYDPRQPHHLRYVQDPPPIEKNLEKKMLADCLKINKALGYDMNTVEFAVEDGVPYAIDFGNPAPDADYDSVGHENFVWVVEAMAELAIQKAKEPIKAGKDLRWSKLL
jgi:hypothetical protein